VELWKSDRKGNNMRREAPFMGGRSLMIFPTLILVLVLISGMSPASEGDEVARGKALEAAQKWLTLVDKGEYGKSWEAASGYFQRAVPEGRWEQTLRAVRAPLGKVISRKVKSRQYTTALPGAPDGEYVVIQFQTSFENKKSSLETVTPMKEKDGSWRVSGYFIK
jgi:hypothetical protein